MKRWSKEEADVVRKYFGTLSYAQIGRLIGRSRESVKWFALRSLPPITSDQKRALCAAAVRDQSGDKNGNWKGGVSDDAYRYKRLQRARHPERIAARDKVYKAIKSGRLARQPCEVCGELPAHAHHDDYSKPLDVRWLCKTHHMEKHNGMAVGR